MSAELPHDTYAKLLATLIKSEALEVRVSALETGKEKHDSFEIERNRWKRRIAERDTKIAELGKDGTDLRADIRRIEQEFEGKFQAIAGFRMKVSELESMDLDLRTRIKVLDTRETEWREKYARVMRLNADAQQMMERKDESYAEAVKRVKVLERELSNLHEDARVYPNEPLCPIHGSGVARHAVNYCTCRAKPHKITKREPEDL